MWHLSNMRLNLFTSTSVYSTISSNVWVYHHIATLPSNRTFLLNLWAVSSRITWCVIWVYSHHAPFIPTPELSSMLALCTFPFTTGTLVCARTMHLCSTLGTLTCPRNASLHLPRNLHPCSRMHLYSRNPRPCLCHVPLSMWDSSHSTFIILTCVYSTISLTCGSITMLHFPLNESSEPSLG